jgi:FkbM family methyltransferase
LSNEREYVWNRILAEVPKFAIATPLQDNWETVQEIVLGGSPPWRHVNTIFAPCEGTRVMDIGANRGVYAMYCAVHGANVVAYEPFPLLYDLLESLVYQTQVTTLRVVKAAVAGFTGQSRYIGHQTAVEDFYRYNGGLQTCGVNWTEDDHARSTVTECVSLDDAIGDEEWDMVKVDVEGAEAEIFLNASEKTLSLINSAFVEFHPWIPDPEYQRMIDVLTAAFKFEGTYVNDRGRWDAAHLSRRRS